MISCCYWKMRSKSIHLLWFKFSRQIAPIRLQWNKFVLSWKLVFRWFHWLLARTHQNGTKQKALLTMQFIIIQNHRPAKSNQTINFSAIFLQPKELSKSWSRSQTAVYRQFPEVCHHLEVAFHLYLSMLDIRRQQSRVQRPPEDDTEPHLHR